MTGSHTVTWIVDDNRGNPIEYEQYIRVETEELPERKPLPHRTVPVREVRRTHPAFSRLALPYCRATALRPPWRGSARLVPRGPRGGGGPVAFPALERIASEEDLESLRDEDRFKELVHPQ